MEESQKAPSPERPPEPLTRVNSTHFRHIIGHFPSGVTVVTVNFGGSRYGATASAFCSLSLNPPMVLVCLKSDATTATVISQSRHFAISILGEDQSDVALRFASRLADKFEGLSGVSEVDGQPVIDNAVAQLRCEVAEIATGGTHSIFLARILDARLQSRAPLTYFRGSFGSFLDGNRNKAYYALRSAVLDRKYLLDAVLSAPHLAADLSLDEVDTSYALSRLVDEGLLLLNDRFKYRINPVEESLLRQTLDARRTLTIGVVELVGRKLTPAQLSELHDAARAAAPPPGDLADAASQRAVHSFHRQLISLSQNSTTIALYETMSVPKILNRALWGVDWSNLQQRMSEQYIALSNALAEQDIAKAVIAISKYSDIALEECLRFLRTSGGRL